MYRYACLASCVLQGPEWGAVQMQGYHDYHSRPTVHACGMGLHTDSVSKIKIARRAEY